MTCRGWIRAARSMRSEEHTSELQSPQNLVCRLLLEKKRARSEEHTSELQSPQNLVCRLLLEKPRRSRAIRQTGCNGGSWNGGRSSAGSRRQPPPARFAPAIRCRAAYAVPVSCFFLRDTASPGTLPLSLLGALRT